MEEVVEFGESPIPPNVREQYRIILQEWKEDDKLYYETHNFSSMIDKVRNQPFVTFVGVPGSGKSATAYHIALKLHEEGHEVVPIRDIKELKVYCDHQEPRVFVIDDVVGVHGLQKTKLDVLADYKGNITTPSMAKSKTLMTCREVVFNELLSYKPFFTDESTIVKLHSSENVLNDNDKKQILKKYGLNVQQYELDVDSLLPSLPASTSHRFPLLCKLFSKGKHFQAFGETFFTKPVQCIMDEFDGMQRGNTIHYATLVLCVMKENCLSRNDLNDEDFVKRKQDVLEKCKLESNTDTFKFEGALLAMEGTYTQQNADGQYSFIHDSIHEMCAYHFGKQFPGPILKCMSITYLANFVKPQTNETRMAEKQMLTHSHEGSSNENECRSAKEDKDNESDEYGDANNDRKDSFDFCIMLRKEQYPLLARRLYREIESMELYEVFRIAALKHPQVCKAFIAELKTKSYAELKSLFLHQKKDIDKIVSKRDGILEGSEDINQWSEEKEIQRLFVTERVISNETTPHVRVISWVIYYGHSEILKFIIEQTEKHHEEGELFMLTRNSQRENTGKTETQVPIASHAGSNNQCIDINSAMEQIRLLLMSCYSGDLETLETILSHASLPSINGIYHDNADETDFVSLRSPLTVTCSRGHAVMAYKLLKAGADIDIQDGNRHTPLVAACDGGHVDVVDVLVKENANVNLQDGHGNTPLVTACREGHVDVVESLMKAGADIRESDINGFTPLVAACREGRVRVVKLLLKTGGDIQKTDNRGTTPLIAACYEGHVDVIELLIKEGASIDKSDDNGYTPLVTACRGGHVGVVKLLLKTGGDIRKNDNNGNTPLVAACYKGHVDVVELLLGAGADVRDRDGNGYTPLVAACYEGHVEVVALLTRAGADIRESNKIGWIPLTAACYKGHVSVVELLMKAGANITESDKNGKTPLVAACREGRLSVVDLLLKEGADIRQSDKNGDTPLIAACYKGHLGIVELLIKGGVDLNKINKHIHGYTPLIAACSYGQKSVVEKLVESGADVNLANVFGYTPLGYACLNGNVNMVKMLLKYDVNINQRDSKGETALNIAYRRRNKSVIEELEKALARCQSTE